MTQIVLLETEFSIMVENSDVFVVHVMFNEGICVVIRNSTLF